MTTSAPPAVIYPVQPMDPSTVVPFAELVDGGSARRLWMGQSMLVETHQALAYAAGMGLRVPVGTSVTLTPLRHPFEAAVQARSLALLTGQPVVAGFGASTPEFVTGLHGRPYPRPATAAAEYAHTVRSFLDGGGVDHAGIRLRPVPHPPVEVGLGVIRPGMARLAGAVADVVITWMTPPAYIRGVLAPAVAAGAAGRERPPRIAAVVHAALARPGRDPRRLTLAVAAPHLSAAHYTDMLRRAGIAADPADPEVGAAAFVDAGGYVYGTVGEVARAVREYSLAGVDEVILNAGGVMLTEGPGAAVADLVEILAAVREVTA